MLLYLKQKINKDQLYNTGNYIQYHVTTYKEKESEKVYIYMCKGMFVSLNHFATPPKHCKLTRLWQK